jgi:hypothetical protein
MSVPRAWYDGDVFGEILWTEDSEAHISRHDVTPLEVADNERRLFREKGC